MTPMSSTVILARLDRLDNVMNFFAQCPASKRGKPMDPGQAIHQEKKNPGSVCMKVSRARDGRGVRHIFYKVASRAEKAAQKAKQPTDQNSKQEARPQKKAKPLTPVEMLKRKAAAITAVASPTLAKKPASDTPTFHSGIKGLSDKQQKWGKIFHHSLERLLRAHIASLGDTAAEMKPYTQEAWTNLTKLETAGSIFGLKGLDGEGLFWALLSPQSAKQLAVKTETNLAAEERGPIFARIMKGKFKGDTSFQDAAAAHSPWPAPPKAVNAVSRSSRPPIADPATVATKAPSPVSAKAKAPASTPAKVPATASASKAKPLDDETKWHAEEASREVEESLRSFGRQLAMGEIDHGSLYGEHFEEALKALKEIIHPKTLAEHIDRLGVLNNLQHDPEKLFLKLLSPQTLEQIKQKKLEGKKGGNLGATPAAASKVGKLKRLAQRVKDSKLVGKVKEKAGKAKEKVLAAKRKYEEWEKAHPILSTGAKWAAKLGLGSLGLMQDQSPSQRILERLDCCDRVIKFYAQCPGSKA